MLLPMPAMPQPSGPLSEYAVSRRPVVLGVLIFQSILVMLRIFMFLDIMGGFIMALVVALGWYAWKEDMHITFICYWGMMCLVQGMFGLAQFLDAWVHGGLSFEGSAAIFAIIQLCMPISYALGAFFAWHLYQDASTEALPYSVSAPYGAESRPLGRSAAAGSGTFGSSKPAFQAFGGAGNRLGSA
eukprot:gnl/TRDRNA2_/TRDRNA2_189335_c0_seq1.p1 gnl/TRDRNA2_/TRDRNA2_189335_c0~~gnl/TRDRNA2_/TRDRNA2_189335_c0_seq1.p1  ORF type:complete len:186 (-),score=28.35 gnl/TRDRNA2_/TRDRNA2_189335_c0_seq1:47-604(-)